MRTPVPVTKSPQAWMSTSPFGSSIEQRRQRLSHRRLPEHARAAERLHAARETLRRAARHPVDENGDGTLVRLDALAGGIDEPRIRGELQRPPAVVFITPSVDALGHEVPGERP